MTTLIVLSKRVGPIRGHHPWVFSGALKAIPEGLKSGDAVALVDEAGVFLASGYFNSYSQIAVRLWSWEAGEIVDVDFFVRRVARAFALRKQFVANKETNAFRLINGENDSLPGCIVDMYDEYLCIQFHNQGIEMWKEQIVAALVKTVVPKGIYERSDVRDRLRGNVVIKPNESYPSRHPDLVAPQDENKRGRLLYGKMPERVMIKENGKKFIVDVVGGQKTGFFLDQRDKRAALEKYSSGKSVLNCFSYTGGFSVYALAAGAARVVSVDASEGALKIAEENVKLNKLDEEKCEFIVADVKEYLADRQPGEFDVIILDPPAFVKDRHKIREGLQGYRNINEQALRILPTGGILVTASCSAHVALMDFRFMLSEAAARAGRTVQILETFTHGIDHPELVAFTEGEYLKCLFVIVN